ncbi:phage holin family protein [Pseudomonas maioricensis]|uniref:phage holin family protein n=1 Tax=Pseudomonas maioricensis TaxID=1766623 RepID=UPI001FADA92A|nr:phage holin family protein [Pseudomonas sp. S25]
MPDKPDSWAALWVALSNPLWQGALMAILICCLRILYEAKETSKRRMIFEALICGGLSLSATRQYLSGARQKRLGFMTSPMMVTFAWLM